MHVFVCVCVCECVCMYVYVCMHVRMHACVYVCVHACACVHGVGGGGHVEFCLVPLQKSLSSSLNSNFADLLSAAFS